jgi:hypothetical protein
LTSRTNQGTIKARIRKQKLFTLAVIALVTELSAFFSLSSNLAFDALTLAVSLLLFGSIAAFGLYYFLVSREASRSPFFHLRIVKGKDAEEHITRVKWPVLQIGLTVQTKPNNTQESQQGPPISETEIESHRLFSNYYVNTYAQYLKRGFLSPVMIPDPSRPSLKLIYEPAEHYYFDQDTLNLVDSRNQKKTDVEDIVERNPVIDKQDSLYFVLLTGVAYCSTVLNAFLGAKVLESSILFLLCLFAIPFYRGYLKGSLGDDFRNRLRGWEDLVLISIIFPTITLSYWFVLPRSYEIILLLLNRLLRASLVQPLTIVVTGGISFVGVFAILAFAALVARAVAIGLTKFYFDSSSRRRPDILGAVSFAGDARRTSANEVLSAMLHRIETEVTLGNEILTVRNGMANSINFIRGVYGKGWNWFLDTYVLCLSLVSIFVLLMHVL